MVLGEIAGLDRRLAEPFAIPGGLASRNQRHLTRATILGKVDEFSYINGSFRGRRIAHP